MNAGLIPVLFIPKKVLGVGKNIYTLISLMKMANSLLKELQGQKLSNLNYKESINNGTLFAKFANVNFSA